MTQEEKETLLGWVKEPDTLRLVPHKDYEIKHDGDNFYLVKKKPKYPKTYEECCKVLSLGEDGRLYTKGYKASLIQDFQKLLICRDAYWKIAGEEMGLGKPWEPTMETVYCISRNNNVMKCSYRGGKSNVLEFPTEEMRDAFHENFKEEIEQCKELL